MPNSVASEKYRVAQKHGKRYLQEHETDQWGGLLPVLEVLLPSYKENTVSLGIVDAPMSKVRGTVATGRAAAFAGNFCPLLSDRSEFGLKWSSLYEAHLKEGIRDAGVAYEYLGYYYILEGHKRVSVLKALDCPSVQLDVTRILPNPDAGDLETKLYLEFLGDNRRRPIKHMWFSKLGSVTKLRALMEEAVKPEYFEDWADDAFFDFRRVYRELGLEKLTITTGDAFLSFVQLYGFPYHWAPAELEQKLRYLERQLQYMAGEPRPQTRSIKPKTKHAIFVYDHKPETHYWDAIHDYGRLTLSRVYPQATIEVVTDFADAEAPDALLQSLCGRDAVMFVTGRSAHTVALRALLSQKETLLCHCCQEATEDILPTYYGRTAEPAFLMGAMAGTLTTTNLLGWIDPPENLPLDPQGVTAFALGARMVNRHARVIKAKAPTDGASTDGASADAGLQATRLELAAMGCDMVFMPYLQEGAEGHGFPGVVAQLISMNPENGYILEYYAAMAWRFGVFYSAFCTLLWDEKEMKDLHPGGEPIHFESGLDSGLLTIHVKKTVLSPYTLLLLDTLERVVKEAGIPKGPQGSETGDWHLYEDLVESL